MSDNFKEELREKFIKLIESERGIQAKLAKSVGKQANYFSAVKRGNPVNAYHLKAVGIIFGHEKVCELLGIVNFKKAANSDTGTIEYEDVLHAELVKQFKQKNLAKECNMKMIELEKLDPSELKEVRNFIEFRINQKASKQNGWTGGKRRKKKVV